MKRDGSSVSKGAWRAEAKAGDDCEQSKELITFRRHVYPDPVQGINLTIKRNVAARKFMVFFIHAIDNRLYKQYYYTNPYKDDRNNKVYNE